MIKKITVLMTLLIMSNSVLSQSIDDIKGDMHLNEVKLLMAPEIVGWSKKATVGMGAVPRGDNTPSWWQPKNPIFKSSDYWNAIIPWFVIYPGERHSATNVRVIISDMKLYILKKSTDRWSRINSVTTPNGQKHQAHISPSTAGESVDVRAEPSGAVSYKLNSGMNPIHGWISPKHAIDGSDVKAVYATMTTRLILDDPNGIDDSGKSRLAANIGVDYYPNIDSELTDFYPELYIPAAGFSRYGLIKKEARTHYFATIDPPGPNNTGAEYADRNQNTTIPVEDFLANPPPGVW